MPIFKTVLPIFKTVLRIRREHASGKAIKAIVRDMRLSRKVEVAEIRGTL